MAQQNISSAAGERQSGIEINVEVVANGYEPKGFYQSTDVTGRTTATKAILFLHDMYGASPQALQGADILATSASGGGYCVFMPLYLMEGDKNSALDITEFPPREGNKDDIEKLQYLLRCHSADYLAEVLAEWRLLLQDGYTNIKEWAIVGVGWGADAARELAWRGMEGRLKVVAMGFPTVPRTRRVDKLWMPVLLVAGEKEKPEKVEAFRSALQVAFRSNLKVENRIEIVGESIEGCMGAKADLSHDTCRGEFKRSYETFLEFVVKYMPPQSLDTKPVGTTHPSTVKVTNIEETPLVLRDPYIPKIDGSSRLLSTPLEVVSRIFGSCDDFADVLNLSSTCHYLKNLFENDAHNIIHQVSRNIPSFDEALIVVLSTKLVRDAYTSKQPPPEIDLYSLSAPYHKPTIPELESVLNVRQFARFLGTKFLLRSKTKTSWGVDGVHILDSSPELLPKFTENFHRATYKFLTAGAALSRAYQLPFFEADEPGENTPEDFLSNAIYRLGDYNTGHLDDQISELPMTDEELSYLGNTYPVYNFMSHNGWDKDFGRLGDWIVGESRERLSRDSRYKDDEKRIERAVLREVMQFLVLYAQVCDLYGGLTNIEEPYWSKHRLDADGDCTCQNRPRHSDKDAAEDNEDGRNEFSHENDEDDHDKDDADEEEEHQEEPGSKALPVNLNPKAVNKTRTAPLVFFGSFVPLDYTMPSSLASITSSSHCTAIEPPSVVGNADIFPDISLFCDMLNAMSGRPNLINGHPAPHPPLHFFTFVLKKYFGLAFDDAAFETKEGYHSGTGEAPYETFVRKGSIFLDSDESRDGDEWDGMLCSIVRDLEPVLGYREMGFADMVSD